LLFNTFCARITSFPFEKQTKFTIPRAGICKKLLVQCSI